MAALDAMSAALEFLRKPVLVHTARGAPLPAGVETLLQIAVGNPEITAATARSTGRSEDSLRRAAGFFIEQILLDPAADSYRCLGLTNAATPRELRLHVALLTRWLHPDAVTSSAAASDRALYASRVTGAWENVKLASRRDRYDLARAKSRKVVKVARTDRANSTARPSLAKAPHPASKRSKQVAGKKSSPSSRMLAITPPPKRRLRRLSLFRLKADGLMARFLAALRGANR